MRVRQGGGYLGVRNEGCQLQRFLELLRIRQGLGLLPEGHRSQPPDTAIPPRGQEHAAVRRSRRC